MNETERNVDLAELKQDEDVRIALEQTVGQKTTDEPESNAKHGLSLGLYIILLVAAKAGQYVLQLGYLNFIGEYVSLLEQLAGGLIAVCIVGIASKLVKIFFISTLKSGVARFNLRRIVNLISGIAVFFIILSRLFADWQTTVVSLGLISLILGFALQTPITSFIGWIYILVRAPYQVGDRIKIGDAHGDVIDVSYLDTTLWEFGGDYLTTDHPSGRIIKFPNSNVLSSAVYNYTWSLFPYIWTENVFQIDYTSDLEFVAKVMTDAATAEVGEEMMDRVRTYRQLLEHTPVDQTDVEEHPTVTFRVNDNTWIDAVVRYLVKPKSATKVRSRMTKRILVEFNAAQDKVQFPTGGTR